MKARVLVVDDEKNVRLSIKGYLEDSDFAVLEAGNGLEALTRLDDATEEEKPDVVLADLKMPVMDGFTMIPKIYQQHPNIPVIVISGSINIYLWNKEEQHPEVFECLSKPLDLAELEKTIDQGISAREAL